MEEAAKAVRFAGQLALGTPRDLEGGFCGRGGFSFLLNIRTNNTIHSRKFGFFILNGIIEYMSTLNIDIPLQVARKIKIQQPPINILTQIMTNTHKNNDNLHFF